MAITAIKAKNTVESLRDVVQDLLVPELKALKVTVDSHRNETKIQFDATRSEFDSFRTEIRSSQESLRNEMKSTQDSLRNEMTSGFEALRTEMRIRDEKQTQALQALSDKLGVLIEVRERLAVLEDRAKRT
ncbi:MAG TPA: hypothetical protein VHY48_04075 [Acidobacteriaceae bacterium]|jgi:hypothetical protein|nr:hypothetical protein [Acidobacteriaceae bacterium]